LRLERRPWAVGAAALGFVMLAVYIALIATQGGGSLSEAMPWAIFMTIAPTGTIVASQVQDRRTAKILLVGSAIVWALLGFVSLLSIGVGFLIAAGAASAAAIRIPSTDHK
jgi:hypothetical protein